GLRRFCAARSLQAVLRAHDGRRSAVPRNRRPCMEANTPNRRDGRGGCLDASPFHSSGDVQLLGKTDRCARSFSATKRPHRASGSRSSDALHRSWNHSNAGCGSRRGRTGRCVPQLGLRRAQIRTHVDANPNFGRGDTLNLDKAALQPVWSAAEKLDAAIFVHPWDMLGSERMPKYWLPWLVGMPAETSLAICSMIFGGVFERFPTLRVAFAHGGGAFPFTI